MELYIDELFSIDEMDHTLKISTTSIVFWTDERLALTSYPDCWKDNQILASACNETESFTMQRERASMRNKVS